MVLNQSAHVHDLDDLEQFLTVFLFGLPEVFDLLVDQPQCCFDLRGGPLELDLLYGPRSASVTVTSGDQDTARAQGWSTCEEDDADADIGDHVLSMLSELRYEYNLTVPEE